MTVKMAERITGLTVKRIEVDGKAHWYWLLDAGGRKVVEASGYGASDTLKKLVEKNYRRVCAIVRERAGYKCGNCGSMRGGTECHHRVKRSHGRVDSESNIISLCPDCHRIAHGGKAVHG